LYRYSGRVTRWSRNKSSLFTENKNGSTSLLFVEKISPLPNVHVACSTKKKKNRSRVFQKAIELTSCLYKSAPQATEKRKRVSQNRPGNWRQKQENEVNFLHYCWFCAVCEEVSEESTIQCMSCKKWCHESCAGVKKDKKGFFAATQVKLFLS
jgi:hypothetical protein